MDDLLFIALCCVTLIVKCAASPDNNQCMDEEINPFVRELAGKVFNFKTNAQSNFSIVSAFLSIYNSAELAMNESRHSMEIGFCGYYARTEDLTTSGWPYSPSKFTASHPTLPFNTMVLVSNGVKAVVVKVNDRWPKSEGHVLDLSAAAAKALSMGKKRVIRCSVKVLQIGDNRLRGDPEARRPCLLTWYGRCTKNSDCCSGCCKKLEKEIKGRCVPKTPYRNSATA